METFAEKSLTQFSQELYDKTSVPGGGGAAALVGALSASLCAMAANFTVGKKKYLVYDSELHRILDKMDVYRISLLNCIDKDAEGFAPLSNAYSLSKDDPNRQSVLDKASLLALEAPLEIVKTTGKIIDLLMQSKEMTSRLLLSDIACSAYLASSALKSAAINVFVNTKVLSDKETANKINSEVDLYLQKCNNADHLADSISKELRG